MSRWFRHYAGLCRDDKLVRAAVRSKQPVDRVCWLWIAILESAAEIDDGGRYEIDHGEIAYFLRIDETDIAAIESAFVDLGRVEDGCVAKWKTRQFQADRTGGKSRGGDSYVYFIGTAWGEPVKIGYSRNPWSRLAEFQTGSPAKLSVLAAFKTGANSEVEIHTLLSEHRSSGEWFALPSGVVDTITAATKGKKASYEDLVAALRAQLRSATNTETETKTDIQLADANCSSPQRRHADWPSDFPDRLWAIFPRKTGKKAGIEALQRVHRADRVGWADIVAGVEAMFGCDPQYVPELARWLKNERWKDERPTSRSPPAQARNTRSLIDGLDEIERRFSDVPAPSYPRLAG